MSFSVAVGSGGLAGWNLLQRTADTQKQIISRDPVVARSITYFKDKISTTTASSLVNDYQLLKMTLGTFGLESDVANKAFVRKILEADRSDSKSLINRLSDKRYLRMSDALQLDKGDQRVSSPGFGDRFANLYIDREFERRVGESDENLRLALNAKRELEVMSKRSSSDETLWFEVLGNPPLRKMFETAFGFSSSYGKLPIDRQHQEFMKKAEQVLGTSSFKEFGTTNGSEKLIRTFLVRSQLSAEGTAQTRYSTALTLLRGY